MRTRLMIATAAVAVLLAGAASAQPAGATGSNFSQEPQPAGANAVNPPPADQLPAGVATGNATVTGPTPSGQAGSGDATAPSASANRSGADAANVAPAAGAPAERQSTDAAGIDVISNGPVPDTPDNRAKYGQPLSHAGRLTKPAGN